VTYEEARELIPAYALNALEPSEAREAEAHLAVCDKCRHELAGLREGAAAGGRRAASRATSCAARSDAVHCEAGAPATGLAAAMGVRLDHRRGGGRGARRAQPLPRTARRAYGTRDGGSNAAAGLAGEPLGEDGRTDRGDPWQRAARLRSPAPARGPCRHRAAGSGPAVGLPGVVDLRPWAAKRRGVPTGRRAGNHCDRGGKREPISRRRNLHRAGARGIAAANHEAGPPGYANICAAMGRRYHGRSGQVMAVSRANAHHLEATSGKRRCSRPREGPRSLCEAELAWSYLPNPSPGTTASDVT
jgi:hypothetical protein